MSAPSWPGRIIWDPGCRQPSMKPPDLPDVSPVSTKISLTSWTWPWGQVKRQKNWFKFSLDFQQSQSSHCRVFLALLHLATPGWVNIPEEYKTGKISAGVGHWQSWKKSRGNCEEGNLSGVKLCLLTQPGIPEHFRHAKPCSQYWWYRSENRKTRFLFLSWLYSTLEDWQKTNKQIHRQLFIGWSYAPVDSTMGKNKFENCLVDEHMYAFFLSLFPEESTITTIYIALTLLP